MNYTGKIEMTLWRAVVVAFWRVLLRDTWRGVSERWINKYGGEKRLSGNQFHGLDVMEAAASRLGMSSYLLFDKWPWQWWRSCRTNKGR